MKAALEKSDPDMAFALLKQNFTVMASVKPEDAHAQFGIFRLLLHGARMKRDFDLADKILRMAVSAGGETHPEMTETRVQYMNVMTGLLSLDAKGGWTINKKTRSDYSGTSRVDTSKTFQAKTARREAARRYLTLYSDFKEFMDINEFPYDAQHKLIHITAIRAANFSGESGRARSVLDQVLKTIGDNKMELSFLEQTIRTYVEAKDTERIKTLFEHTVDTDFPLKQHPFRYAMLMAHFVDAFTKLELIAQAKHAHTLIPSGPQFIPAQKRALASLVRRVCKSGDIGLARKCVGSFMSLVKENDRSYESVILHSYLNCHSEALPNLERWKDTPRVRRKILKRTVRIVTKASAFFDQQVQNGNADVILYTAMIEILAKASAFEPDRFPVSDVFQLIETMIARGIQPDSAVFSAASKAFTEQRVITDIESNIGSCLNLIQRMQSLNLKPNYAFFAGLWRLSLRHDILQDPKSPASLLVKETQKLCRGSRKSAMANI